MEVQDENLPEEGIVRHFGPPYVIRDGTKVFGARIWDGIMDVNDHLLRHKEAYPDRILRIMSGYGNLLANPYFLAVKGGKFYHLYPELENLSQQEYSCVVDWNDGHITCENLKFKYDVKIKEVHILNNGLDISNQVRLVFSGQKLVDSGKPVDIHEIAKATYDVRHLFRLPLIQEFGYHFGVEELILNVNKRQKALDESVNLPLRMINTKGEPRLVDKATLRFELLRMEYNEVTSANAVRRQGQFYIGDKEITIFLLPSIYPHSAFFITKDVVGIYQIHGLSNRTGISISNFTELLVEYGADHAILLDNGDDVFCYWQGAFFRTLKKDEIRTRMRAVLVFSRSFGDGDEIEKRPNPVQFSYVTY